jgi:AcrR family transcriptional regulator
MPRGRKPQSPDASRRNDLLRAAARLFVEKGFNATTTRDIAEAVGMRSGSPFYHFRSKQELLKAAIIGGLEAAYERLLAATAEVTDSTDAEPRLRAMIRAHLGNLLEGECPTPMLLGETRALDASDKAEIAAAFDRYQLPWQSVLNDLAASGKLPSAAPPVRLLLFGMLNWAPQWYRAEGPLSLDELTEACLALLLGRERGDEIRK